MNQPLLNMLMAPLLLVLAACAGSGAKAPRTSSTLPDAALNKVPAAAASMPAEDLTRYRRAFPVRKAAFLVPLAPKQVVPTNQVNTQVEQRLRDQAYTNQNVKYAQGYRILVYLGIERDKAMAVRRAIIGRYPDETDYFTFKSPVYRLYIGDYLTKLDAARGLARLRGLAPKLELETTQVLLNKKP